MRRRTSPTGMVCVLALILFAGCGAGGESADDTAAGGGAAATSAPTAPAATRSTVDGATITPRPGPDPSRSSEQSALIRGIDASHHQGSIGWQQVAGAGYEFAYLKATEGQTYVDPRFAANRTAAIAAGLQVAGYHYFSLCSPGTTQAEHLASVLGDISGPDHLPPAIDLELAGSCTTPPPRAALLAEVRSFLRTVERRTGRRPVVYLYPEFEAEYGFAPALAGYQQWVRALGDQQPARPWWIWQRSATGSVPGIAGPADINLMRRR